ncbi:MAG: hypothetical protein PQJ59_04830 [Spirochaetales bacterium]|nr:hypothetical protein [Spirochaetales bacterium]
MKVIDYESQELRDDLEAGALIGLKGANFTEDNRETQVYLTREGARANQGTYDNLLTIA